MTMEAGPLLIWWILSHHSSTLSLYWFHRFRFMSLHHCGPSMEKFNKATHTEDRCHQRCSSVSFKQSFSMLIFPLYVPRHHLCSPSNVIPILLSNNILLLMILSTQNRNSKMEGQKLWRDFKEFWRCCERTKKKRVYTRTFFEGGRWKWRKSKKLCKALCRITCTWKPHWSPKKQLPVTLLWMLQIFFFARFPLVNKQTTNINNNYNR